MEMRDEHGRCHCAGRYCETVYHGRYHSAGAGSCELQRGRGLSDDELARTRNAKIGFVFQNFNLLSKITALQNVALPLVYAGVPEEERLERARIALRDVGLEDRVDHKPNELSGGQRQRVAIARALVNNPAIVMADEPTGNLDTKSSYEIMEIFKKLNAMGKTIVMVTHEPDIGQQTKRILVMRDGHLNSDERLVHDYVQ